MGSCGMWGTHQGVRDLPVPGNIASVLRFDKPRMIAPSPRDPARLAPPPLTDPTLTAPPATEHAVVGPLQHGANRRLPL